ncbi:septal ring lytic transglycosylase RlpA family protein [Asinibacterium sp. OR53]|uniref:septal ring lytic transglycosylase RlpA family protein n=1 Tax=Asinibacterium sp. OR53 TaxID=925409 RepID=UPI000479A7E4|nr:septal ring lytic transglycosylase RlpA family protein [Asinibacterium sp. OR53]
MQVTKSFIRLAIPLLLVITGCSRRITETGMASYYGVNDGFNGRKTANGEIFNTYRLTAAHKTLPFGTVVKVTNLSNGESVKVRINDRGPYIKGRIIDLSAKAAEKIDMTSKGIAQVKLSYKKKKK